LKALMSPLKAKLSMSVWNHPAKTSPVKEGGTLCRAIKERGFVS
jgi:hypothetical protein